MCITDTGDQRTGRCGANALQFHQPLTAMICFGHAGQNSVIFSDVIFNASNVLQQIINIAEPEVVKNSSAQKLCGAGHLYFVGRSPNSDINPGDDYMLLFSLDKTLSGTMNTALPAGSHP
jgi:hypothetical protein